MHTLKTGHFSTFNKSEVFWQNAEIVTKENDRAGFDNIIQSKSSNSFLTGTGVINGRVIENDDTGGRVVVGSQRFYQFYFRGISMYVISDITNYVWF